MGGMYSRIYNWMYPKKDYDQFLLQYVDWLNENKDLEEFCCIYKENAQKKEISEK